MTRVETFLRDLRSYYLFIYYFLQITIKFESYKRLLDNKTISFCKWGGKALLQYNQNATGSPITLPSVAVILLAAPHLPPPPAVVLLNVSLILQLISSVDEFIQWAYRHCGVIFGTFRDPFDPL